MKTISRFTILGAATLALAAFPLQAATYYVDDTGGNDSNAGTSSGAAWRTLTKVNGQTFAPGDSLLFKAGGVWTGQLHPLGTGSSGNAITIDRYGTGAAPLIQGNGNSATVLLDDQQFWTVKNLDITNNGTAGTLKRGIHVRATDLGQADSIHLVNLRVHDVTGDPADKDSAAIFFEAAGTTTPTYFYDVVIEGCLIHDVTRSGITSNGTWKVRTESTNTNWTPSLNVVIKNNVIADCAGNGLIWLTSDGAHIYNNVWSHNGDGISGNAMFVWNCDDSVIEYNEAYDQVFDVGDLDAGGFDADYKCKRTIIQYNYSHDNGMAGIVAVSSPPAAGGFNQNPKIRYNILQNNAGEAFRVGGYVTDAEFYNNTIYIDSSLSGVTILKHWKWTEAGETKWPDNTQYENNIFVNHSTSSNYEFDDPVLGSSTNDVFDYNVFYGQHPASEPADSHKSTTDPRLTDAGTGALGWETVDGYKLYEDSAALGSGVLIANNGGLDYWGNAVSASTAPNRGAYNGAGLAAATARREFEGIFVAASSGDQVEAIVDGAADAGGWSKLHADAVNDHVTYSSDLPAGTYSIQVRTKKLDDRGIVQLATSGDGTNFYDKDGPKDLYAATETWTTLSYTDTVTFSETGTKYFRFQATGKNAASSGYVVPLDSVTLTKLGDKKEFENLPFFASTGETLTLTSDVDADHGIWTKYAANGVNDFVTYAFHVPAGTYSIQVHTKKFTDRGTVQLATSSDNSAYYNKDAAKDLYAASAAWTTLSYTDTVTFATAGIKYFRFTVTGKNASSTDYILSLDSLALTKL